MLLLDVITRSNATECFSCWDYAFPGQIPYLVSVIYNILKIGVPILLVILGMIDFGKSVVAKDQEAMKASQQAFIRRLIAAAIVFVVLLLVQFLIKLVTPEDEKESLTDCMNCFLNGECSNASGEYPNCELGSGDNTDDNDPSIVEKKFYIDGNKDVCGTSNGEQYAIITSGYEVASKEINCDKGLCTKSADGQIILTYPKLAKDKDTVTITAKITLANGSVLTKTKQVVVYKNYNECKNLY